MTCFHVEVVEVGSIKEHEYADALEIVNVGGYPVVIRKGSFKSGDKAVYIPEDSVVPDTEEFAFLGSSKRVRAKRLRGVFSMGLLVPVPDALAGLPVGSDVSEAMSITRFDPPEPVDASCEKDLGYMPEYTDIEPLRRWVNILRAEDELYITEKINGSSVRVTYQGGRLWVGTRTTIKKEGNNRWWDAVRESGVEKVLRDHPNMVLFGELAGKNDKYGKMERGFDYDGQMIRFFDAFHKKTHTYYNYPEFLNIANEYSLLTVPTIKYVAAKYATDEELRHTIMSEAHGLSEGNTLIGEGAHIREGFVIHLGKERYEPSVGRVILKHHSETFLLTKG